MQMTTEARAWLDATVHRTLARHPLGDAERAGITYELMSHLHAAGEARAQAAGRSEVAREDLEAALLQAGGEPGLAAAFVAPFAKPVQRVLFWRRAGAYGIDVFLLGIALTFVHGVLVFLLGPLLDGPAPGHNPWRLEWWLPWGHHDDLLPLPLQAAIAVASAGVVLGYFTWFEAHEGRSLGKRALDLRVVRTDGQPMTYREALLRNLAKASPPVLFLDTSVMLLAFREERQRLSDRIAQTIVIRA
ncbi:MAG TPA: RDD family protein [Candidatus Thermoplasmatota archaeon]|nr:RDD family protein [Candidatus Thermoplasmatota archaeon]